MKRIFAIVLACVLAVTLISCTNTNDNQNDNKTDVSVIYENVDLAAVADSLYDGIAEDNRPFVMSTPLTSEDFEYFTFIPYEEGLEAVANEPMISSIAHSIVLVKAPTTEKAVEVASSMKAKCNPRKWMCVEADIVEGVTNGNIAMLLMTTSEGGMAETILNNFKSLDAEKVASLKSEIIEDEFVEDEFIEDEGFDFEGEVEVEGEDVVIDFTEEDAGDEPAAMPEEDNAPAVMPEVDADVDMPAVMPEVDADADVPAVMPEVTPEAVPEVKEEAPAEEVTIDALYAIADKLYEGINPEEMPMVGTMELDSEGFEYSAFVPYKDTYLAVESMPMMGSQPHSVVIVKADSEAEAKALASDMKANANPRKWICVQARSVKSAYKGNYAILVMTSYEVMPIDGIDEEQAEEMSIEKSDERANIIIDNFLAAVK